MGALTANSWEFVAGASLLMRALIGLYAKASRRVISGNVGAMQTFAAEATLTMLASTMTPAAYEEGGAIVGLLTAVGFLVAFILSHLE